MQQPHVTVHCSDKNVEIEMEKLIQFKYFKKALNIGITSVLFEKKKIVENGINYIFYSYKIPELTVDCTESILLILLNTKLYTVHEFNDSVLELMIYIDMYQIPMYITYGGYGFVTEEHFWFVEYIKEQYPYLNPYSILQNSGFSYSYCFRNYNFTLISEGKPVLLKDMLECLEWYINEYDYSVNDKSLAKRVVKSIKYFNEHNPTKTKKYVTTETMSSFIREYNNSHKDFIQIWSRVDIDDYNNDVSEIYNEFIILDKLKLIDINQFEEKDKYLFKS